MDEIKCNELNNIESEIFKDTLNKQIIFIEIKLKKTRIGFFNDKMGCTGEKEVIANHLNGGNARNLIQQFFKTYDACIICKKNKSLQRAHCHNYTRYDLLILAIDELYIDNITPIITGDIFRLFILKHKLCPIYTLCRDCHQYYDKI
jgi:hypothetical protein